MARTVAEWIGKTDDAAVPLRVQLRIWRRDGGICHISKKKINPGDEKQLDHIKALILNGEHRESNLSWALTAFHREKTAAEVADRAESDAQAKKHIGIKADGKTGLEGRSRQTIRESRAARSAGKLPVPPPRSLYQRG